MIERIHIRIDDNKFKGGLRVIQIWFIDLWICLFSYGIQLNCKNYFAERFSIRSQVGTLIYLIVLHKWCSTIHLYKLSAILLLSKGENCI